MTSSSASIPMEQTITPLLFQFTKLPIIFVGLLMTLVLTGITLFIQWRISRRHLYKGAKKIHMPDNMSYYPIIGHAHHFAGGTEKLSNSMMKVLFTQKCPCTVWLAHRLFFFIDSIEDMEIILNSPKSMSKDDLYRFTVPILGYGIFNADLITWKRHRKLISPTFNKKKLDNFVELFSEHANVMIKQLEKYNGKGIFDINHYLENYALDVICESAMGVKINLESNEFGQTVKKSFDIIMTRMFNVLYHIESIFYRTSTGREEQRMSKIISDFTAKVVQKKKEEFYEKQQDRLHAAEAEIEETTKTKAFLEMMIELAKLTDSEIKDETQTLMLAGSDTTATTLSFAFLMMALNQDCQQKLYEEAVDILGPDRPAEADDVPKFTYCDKFLKETMRLFPVGCVIVRKVDDDLDLGHCVLPKDSGIVLGIIAAHMSPKYWKNPTEFNPENFTPEEIVKRNPYSYMPFSGGPRNCVGLKFAMMEMKVLLIMIARKYKIETSLQKVQDVKFKQALIIRSTVGYPIKLTKRD